MFNRKGKDAKVRNAEPIKSSDVKVYAYFSRAPIIDWQSQLIYLYSPNLLADIEYMTTTKTGVSAYRYPVSPKNVNEAILEPSPAFRQEVWKVLASILLFFLTYLGLVAGAMILAVVCGLGGIFIISSMPRFITLIVGAGLVGLGLMVLFFLFKFIFRSNKTDRTHLIEINERDQPLLFEFIRRLAKETQTSRPKRVYLSADVNACVFYDSGFWSMFLPVRKNLQIGLGLVNVVNVSEFKAILAHEFGHFSQRSMKLGSYVYNVNRVIYNMLYDNEGYENTVTNFGNVHGVFQFFAMITIGIVKGIQWLLQRMYAMINERYMALSRQMEFHADSVAAYVSGSAPLITSLRRLDVANTCYDRVIGYYDRWYKENKKADNLYLHHTEVMRHFAKIHNLTIENETIYVSGNSFARYDKARVIIKDQWASHPSTDDREKHLNSLNIEAELVTESAWTLFGNTEALQQKMTNKLYQNLTFQGTPGVIDLKTFRAKYYDDVAKYSIDERYKGFYDGRGIAPFDVDTVADETIQANTLSDILTAEVIELPYLIAGLETDINVLESLQQQTKSSISTFDFSGQKYNKNEITALLEKLRRELSDANAALQKADKEIFLLFCKAARRNGNEKALCNSYKKLFESEATLKEVIEHISLVTRPLQEIYQGRITTDAAYAITHNLKRQEAPIKTQIKELLENADYNSFYTSDQKRVMEMYIEKPRIYFSGDTFNQEAFGLLHEALDIYTATLSERHFQLKKELLLLQLETVA